MVLPLCSVAGLCRPPFAGVSRRQAVALQRAAAVSPVSSGSGMKSSGAVGMMPVVAASQVSWRRTLRNPLVWSGGR